MVFQTARSGGIGRSIRLNSFCDPEVMSVKNLTCSIYSSCEMERSLSLRYTCLNLKWCWNCHTNLANTEPCHWRFFEHCWQEEQHASKPLHYCNATYSTSSIRYLVLWREIWRTDITFAASPAAGFPSFIRPPSFLRDVHSAYLSD